MTPSLHRICITLAALVVTVAAQQIALGNTAPLPLPTDWSRAYETPEVYTLTTSGWNRDSCTSSSLFGRALWQCRDTCSTSGLPLRFYDSSAQWSDFSSSGAPVTSGNTLTTYGDISTKFFPDPSSGCDEFCGNTDPTNRWVMWCDSRPYVNYSPDGQTATIYTWIPKARVKGYEPLTTNPSTLHFKSVVNRADMTSGNTVPTMTQVGSGDFWPTGAIGYGTYGFVENGDDLFLYGQMDFESTSPLAARGVALAKVSRANLEDPSAYQFYVNGEWTDQRPAMGDLAAAQIKNAGTGGQGTFYWSYRYNQFLWIGMKGKYPGPEFYISSAHDPWGNWSTPTLLYTGQDSESGLLGPYSMQAHPGLSINEGRDEDIWLSYTRSTAGGFDNPVIHLKWK